MTLGARGLEKLGTARNGCPLQFVPFRPEEAFFQLSEVLLKFAPALSDRLFGRIGNRGFGRAADRIGGGFGLCGSEPGYFFEQEPTNHLWIDVGKLPCLFGTQLMTALAAGFIANRLKIRAGGIGNMTTLAGELFNFTSSGPEFRIEMNVMIKLQRDIVFQDTVFEAGELCGGMTLQERSVLDFSHRCKLRMVCEGLHIQKEWGRESGRVQSYMTIGTVTVGDVGKKCLPAMLLMALRTGNTAKLMMQEFLLFCRGFFEQSRFVVGFEQVIINGFAVTFSTGSIRDGANLVIERGQSDQWFPLLGMALLTLLLKDLMRA